MTFLKDYFEYLPVSEIEEAWGIYVAACGFSKIPPQSRYPKEKHPPDHHYSWSKGRVLDSFQCLYLSKGSGEFETRETGLIEIEAGTMLVLFPGVWHRYRPNASVGWDEYWVEVDGVSVRRLLKRKILRKHQPVMQVGLSDEVIESYRKCLQVVREKKQGYRPMAASYAFAIIARLSAAPLQSDSKDAWVDERVREAQVYLSEHYERPVRMETLARDLGVSYSYFRSSFKRVTGLSPNQYHLQIRIQKAKEFLEKTNLSIKEISERLHFNSPYHFSSLFSAKVGVSPKRWRHPV